MARPCSIISIVGAFEVFPPRILFHHCISENLDRSTAVLCYMSTQIHDTIQYCLTSVTFIVERESTWINKKTHHTVLLGNAKLELWNCRRKESLGFGNLKGYKTRNPGSSVCWYLIAC